jgi:hypothetical protein
LIPKKVPAVPSNSLADGLPSGAPDTKSYIKNATYPHLAPSLSSFSHLGGPSVWGKLSNNYKRAAGHLKKPPANMVPVSFLDLLVEML